MNGSMPKSLENLPPDVDTLLRMAKTRGVLAPLEQYVAEEGPEASAEDLLKLAQLDERTRGKPPEELVRMFQEDPSLVRDLLALRRPATFSYESPEKMMSEARRKASYEPESEEE
jgi:hypothetical protein